MRTVPEQIVVASRYRVLRELGRGGMGAVFLAEHVHTSDHVALKILLGHASADEHAVERFKREARASARIKSEHVVKVIDADIAPELGDAPFIVMELLDGCDLEKLLAARGKLAPAEVVALLAQAAVALDKSHAIGIIHRDLKPENLFLHRREDGSEMLKVVDFGISKVIDDDAVPPSQRGNLTSSGTMMGTPFYMSPEQAKGHVSELGPAADVWAIGLIAIRLLTGEKYWTAASIAELMVQILSDPMPPPTARWPWLPHGIDAWFSRACARDAAARFKSVGAEVAALAEALGLPADAVLARASTPDASRRTSSGAPPPLLPVESAPTPQRTPETELEAIAAASTLDAVATPPDAAPPRPRVSERAASVDVPPKKRSRVRAVVLGVSIAGGVAAAALVARAVGGSMRAVAADAGPTSTTEAARSPAAPPSATSETAPPPSSAAPPPLADAAAPSAVDSTSTPPRASSHVRPVASATAAASTPAAPTSAAPTSAAPAASASADPRKYNPEAP